MKKSKKFILIGILTITALILLTSIGICLYKKGSLQYEINKIQESYLTNYSQNKFIKKTLKNVEIYNEDKITSYIDQNFDKFLTANDDLYTFIIQYAYLYHNSFDVLSNLRSLNAISFNDYRTFKKYLNNLQFKQVLDEIQYITMKKTSNDILAKKKYFEGIIAQLNFEYLLAESLFISAIEYNAFELSYYNALGNVYNSMYRFNNAIDSYEKGLTIANASNSKNKKVELQLLYNLARTYDNMNNYSLALKTYTTLLVNAIDIHNVNYEWLAVYNISELETLNGNYHTAMSYSKYALKLATKLKNNQYIAKTLTLLSEIEYLYGDYTSGKRNSLKAIKYAKKVSDLNLLSASSLNACLNYENLYKVDLAKVYCERAIKINNVVGKELNRPEYYLQNANVYYFSNTFRDYNKSLQNLQVAYDLSNKYDLVLSKILSLQNMTQVNTILENTKDAQENLEEMTSLENYYQIQDNNMTNSLNGFIDMIQKKYKDAIKEYNKVFNYSIDNKNNSLLSTSSTYLAMLYANINNYKEALRYSKIALNTNLKMYRYDNYNISYQKKFTDMLVEIINNKGK